MTEPLFEYRLELGGFDTRALEIEGEGPRFILFHGFSDSADCWRLVMDGLARAGRAAVALDLPGFATAADLDRHDLVLPQLERFAAASVEHFAQGDEVIVAGNSLGGCTAMLVAERPGLPLAGIVPVAPAGLDMARWINYLERDPLLRPLLSSPIPIPTAAVRAVVGEAYRRLAFANRDAATDDVVRSFTNHFPDQTAALRYINVARRLPRELRDPFRLERITCPVLLVWGRKDVMVFPTGADRVVQTVPDSELVVFEDCGHCPQVEEPHRLTELLLEFPQSLARAA